MSFKEISTFPKALSFTPYNNSDFDLPKMLPPIADNLNVCKVIILGDLCVGKTSLLNRFSHRIFDTNYRTTIGVDFQTEQINILGTIYHLQIWDTAGQERFKCIAQCYYRKAHVIILVFDLSSIRTLASCKMWLRDALEVCKETDNPPFVFLVGTKKDLLSEEGFKSAQSIAAESAKSLNAEFWVVSSKTGENIDDLFFRAAALCFTRDFRGEMEMEKENREEKKQTIGADLISVQKVKKNSNRAKCVNVKCANGV